MNDVSWKVEYQIWDILERDIMHIFQGMILKIFIRNSYWNIFVTYLGKYISK